MDYHKLHHTRRTTKLKKKNYNGYRKYAARQPLEKTPNKKPKTLKGLTSLFIIVSGEWKVTIEQSQCDEL